MLAFLDIEQPNAPQNPMIKEDEQTGLPKRNEMKEKKTLESEGKRKPQTAYDQE